MKELFTPATNIVDKLEKAEVPGQLFLRNTTVQEQPVAQEGPKAFRRVDMHFMKTVAVLIAGILTEGMITRL